MGPSLPTFEKLWAKNPTSILFARLADAYREQGNLDRAIEVCRRGLRYRPSYPTGHMVLGRCLIEADRQEEARQEFEKVLRLDPDHTAALWELGRLEHEAGHLESALKRFESALAVDPFSPILAEVVKALSGEISAAAETGDDSAKAPDSDEGDPDPDEANLLNELDVEETDSEAAGSEETGPAAVETEPRTLLRSPPDSDDPLIRHGGDSRGDTGVRSGDQADGKPAPSVLTLTLADLYVTQGFVGRAVEVLEALAERSPDDERYRLRLKELKTRSS